MKLGVSYTLFDSEELLKASIRCIRDQADYISVVYQTTSFFGLPCSEELIPTIEHLVGIGYIDEVVEYSPEVIEDFHSEKPHLQSIKKRNMGLELSKKQDCTHHMSMDADEFYLPDQFRLMKTIIESEGFDAGACHHSQYYKDEIYMTFPQEQEYVSTIYKISPDREFVYGTFCPVPIDPSRKMNCRNYKIFPRNTVEMHHLSFVRKDIRRKMENCFARTNLDIEKVIEYYNSWGYPMQAMWAGGDMRSVVKVERHFNIWD